MEVDQPIPPPLHPESTIGSSLERLRRILLKPTDFFRSTDSLGSVGPAMAFGLIVHWISRVFEYWIAQSAPNIFDAVRQMPEPLQALPPWLLKMQPKAEFSSWYFGMGSVLVDPLITLIGLLGTSLMIWVSSWILSRRSSGDFETILRITSFCLVANVFRVIPGLGGLIAPIASFVYLVIGLREQLRISTTRAIGIAIFPKLLFFFFFFSLIALAFAFFLKFLGLAV